MSKNQKIILGLWVGLPLLLWAVIFVINPGFFSYYFEGFEPMRGFGMILSLLCTNTAVLIGGFTLINQRVQHKRRWGIVLSTITFFLLTFPTVWLILFYPAVVHIMTPDPLVF